MMHGIPTQSNKNPFGEKKVAMLSSDLMEPTLDEFEIARTIAEQRRLAKRSIINNKMMKIK